MSKNEVQTMGFDIGNSYIRVYFSTKTIVMYNSLLLQKGNVYINKKPTKNCLMDIPFLIGIKYQDKLFERIRKYYNYNFNKGHNKNLNIHLDHQTNIQQFYSELSLLLILKGIYMTNAHLKYLLAQKEIKMISTVFEGEINSYRISLSNCIKAIGVNHFNFVTTNNCIAVSYLKESGKRKDDSEIIGIIDFGDRGFTFTICKICSLQVGIIEVLKCDVNQIGGNALTNLLTDYLAEQLLRDKGMDVTKVPSIMHKLKLLCNEAKHTLSISQMAFVRLDGLPDILVYGCEVPISQFQKCISAAIKQNINLVKSAITQTNLSISKLIINGGSCKIPYFRTILQQELKSIKIVNCNEDWIKDGIREIKSGNIHILDVTSFELRIEGDQKYKNVAICKGQLIPLRKKIIMNFPSGQLTYSMRFYQNNLLIASCHIPERPPQSKYNLYIEVDHNKMLKIYAANSHGLIKMTCNMMDIPKEQYAKYESILTQLDFHNQND